MRKRWRFDLLVALILVLGIFQTTLAQEPETSQEEAVLPPAPFIIKQTETRISIPRELAEAAGKYRGQPVAASSLSLGNAQVGSRFGYRRDPFTRRSRFHSGLDIKAKAGEPVAASQDGVVKYAAWYRGYGNWVIVDHGGGVTTHYAHLSSFAVGEGDHVKRGTIVGYAGRTGRATSPHLHYELRLNDTPVDPLEPLSLDSDSEYFKQSDSDSEDKRNLKPKFTRETESVAPVDEKKEEKAGDGAQPRNNQKPEHVNDPTPGRVTLRTAPESKAAAFLNSKQSPAISAKLQLAR